MRYTPPPFEVADSLRENIQGFLKDCGGIYETQGERVEMGILLCIATGQFYYKKNEYFVSWWKVHEEDLPSIFDKVIPGNIANGNALYIVECGCKNPRHMVKIRSRLRKMAVGLKGVYWQRDGIVPKLFPRQEGYHGK